MNDQKNNPSPEQDPYKDNPLGEPPASGGVPKLEVERLDLKDETQKKSAPKKGSLLEEFAINMKKRRKNKKKRRHPSGRSLPVRIIVGLFKFGLVSTVLGVIVLFFAFAYFTRDLPSPETILSGSIPESTKIFDSTGEHLLYEIHGEERRTIVPFENIPQMIKDATLAAEDDEFYSHIGIDVRALVRAFIANVQSRTINQGGSTITQQYIKNAILSPEQTITRKVKEVILALELERQFTKNEILEAYLNHIPYGSNAYGIESAAKTYFDKSAHELSLAEASVLVALPQAPSRLSPYGSNVEALQKRRTTILDRMVELNYITDEERKEALEQELEYSPQQTGITAPHFVFHVREQLEEQFGSDIVETAGLNVTTSINIELQEMAEEILQEQAQLNATERNASNAALVAIDPTTGHILSMVGSRDYFDTDNDGNVNVATRPRQPGSAFKPVVYAASWLRGFTPKTIVYDSKTEFGLGPTSYMPNNYDLKERGPISLQEALAQSLNIPAVKALYLAGTTETIALAERMGISTLTDPERYGLSLVLGGAEVTLLELTSAYATFATEGEYYKPVSILKVEDAEGEVVFEHEVEGVRALDTQIARQVTAALSNNSLRAPVFGVSNYLNTGSLQSAAKTGTTQESRDGWTMGYTPSLAVGVWTGNNDNTPMSNNTAGVSTAGPIWNRFISRASQQLPVKFFTSPGGVQTGIGILDGVVPGETKLRVNTINGAIAGPGTPEHLIQERTYYDPHNILHYINRFDPRGGGNSQADAQYTNWENGVQDWAKRKQEEGEIFVALPPSYQDNSQHFPDPPTISFATPGNQQQIVSQPFQMMVSAGSQYGIQKVDYYIADTFVGTSTNAPYSVLAHIPAGLEVQGETTIAAIAHDTRGAANRATQTVFFSAGNSSAPVHISSTDTSNFPMRLVVSSPQDMINRDVKFYYSDAGNPFVNFFIGSTFASSNRSVSVQWNNKPQPGTYIVYATVEGQNNELQRTNEMVVTVTQ